MTIINTLLQRIKLRESNHGIYMVFIAYALSVLLLIIGSDALYNIRSKADGTKTSADEENQVTDNFYEAGVTLQDNYPVDYSTDYMKEYSTDFMKEYSTDYIKEYNQDYDKEILKTSSSYTDWILGLALNNSEFNRLLDCMESGDIESFSEKAAEKEEDTIESFSAKKENAPVISLTDEEIGMLERIVEAEASGEDTIGKILVANVVLNRLENDEFPDTIEEVIFQKVGDDYQFSPIADKRYWKVKVTKDTREAVQRALNGEDYSKGALYFVSKKYARKSSLKWFENNLKWLFKHGGHDFYK